jgi:2-phospho-L-lactate guanylyltransferase
VDHSSLSSALALDTVSAAVATVTARLVVVVTADAEVAGRATALGVHVVPDPGTGLNPAVLSGLADLRHRHRDGPTSVLLGDVPAVRATDLAAALAEALVHHRSFVPDTEGTGTVLLTGSTPSALRPHFGSGSAGAHERAGHHRLDLDLPHLRTDVDDEESLRAVLCLGVGAHTAHLLAHLIAPHSREVHDRGA